MSQNVLVLSHSGSERVCGRRPKILTTHSKGEPALGAGGGGGGLRLGKGEEGVSGWAVRGGDSLKKGAKTCLARHRLRHYTLIRMRGLLNQGFTEYTSN